MVANKISHITHIIAISNRMESKGMAGLKKHDIFCNILAAGASAAMLALAHEIPKCWFVSLFALVPFLWRLWYLPRSQAISFGLMLATLFILFTDAGRLVAAPAHFLSRLILANVVFAVFSFGVSRARKSIGFDPLAVALIWFPLQYVLISYTGIGNILQIPRLGSGIIISFCSMFGLLLGSLVFVLINSLIFMLVNYVREKIISADRKINKNEASVFSSSEEAVFEKRWFCFPDVRAPPYIESKTSHPVLL
jgi:hypothetical protein